MRLFIFCCALLFLFVGLRDAECKRGGAGRGGSRGHSKGTGGSGWFWSNNKSSKTKSSNPKEPAPAPATAPKPSAPHPEPVIKKDTANLQQSGNVQRPIGWDVPGTNQNSGWKSGYQAPATGSLNNQQASHYQTGQQQQGAWPAGNHNFNGYPGYQQNGYNPHQPFPGYYPSSNIGVIPPRGADHGHYYNSVAGFNNGPMFTNHQQRGGFGSMLGGSGYGGMGGYGGIAPYGTYGMKKKSGFFSGNAFRNVIAGMFIWHMTSSLLGGLFKRPYSVYNYYNQPAAQEEMKLPSNILKLCDGNVTALCASGTTAICTTNGTVLCVATMSRAAPCAEEKTLCVNATVPCPNQEDPLCRNNSKAEPEAEVNLPCFTNLTVDVNLLNEPGSAQNNNYKYCVTTMAVAGPEYKICPESVKGEASDYRSVLAENYRWNLNVETMVRPYNVYNYKNPTETPSGEIVMPVTVFSMCAQNATKLCAPGVTPICTTFNEIMCLEALSDTKYCEEYNTTCVKSPVPCLDGDPLCDNKTEELKVEGEQTLVDVDLPCFANITVNSTLPNFDIHVFNGTLPAGTNTSYTYHYYYCVTTLGIPGLETDVCVTTSDNQQKQQSN